MNLRAARANLGEFYQLQFDSLYRSHHRPPAMTFERRLPNGPVSSSGYPISYILLAPISLHKENTILQVFGAAMEFIVLHNQTMTVGVRETYETVITITHFCCYVLPFKSQKLFAIATG